MCIIFSHTMELKSPKEIQVEEKITDLVTKIVDEQTFDDELPLRLWNYLQSNQGLVAVRHTERDKENCCCILKTING